jgi:hypothetical protein
VLPSDDLFKAALVAADNAADAEVSTSRLHDCFVWCAPVFLRVSACSLLLLDFNRTASSALCVSYCVAVDDTATVAAHVSHKEKK